MSVDCLNGTRGLLTPTTAMFLSSMFVVVVFFDDLLDCFVLSLPISNELNVFIYVIVRFLDDSTWCCRVRHASMGCKAPASA